MDFLMTAPEVGPLSECVRKAMVLPGSWLRAENGDPMKLEGSGGGKSSCLIFAFYLWRGKNGSRERIKINV